MVRRHNALAATISAALAVCAVLPGQESGTIREFVSFQTPDGSRFLLVPDRSPEATPIVHWAMVTPVGVAEDAPGREGLARAVARASLNGTARYGSRDVARESAALRTLDLLERRSEEATRRGDTLPEELAAELAAARQAVTELGDPSAWRSAVRACPGQLAVAETDGSFVLRVSTLAESLPRLALLILDRRENARLREVRQEFGRVREELRTAQEGPAAIVRREVLGLAFLGSPAARTIEDVPAGFTHDDALATHREIQQPARSFHVLTGGFDPEELRPLLDQVFATTSMEPVPPPPAPTRTERQHSSSTVPTGGIEAYALATPIPADADDRMLAVLGRVLTQGEDSLLRRALRESSGRAFELDFSAPFPPDRRASLFLIEVREATVPPPDRQAAVPPWRQLVADGLAALESDPGAAISEEAVARATRQVVGRIELARASPGRLAFDLAQWCGVLGIDPEVALRPIPPTDVEAARQLATELFLHGARVEVSLERSR